MALTAYFDAGEDAGIDIPDIPAQDLVLDSEPEPAPPPPPVPDVILPPLLVSDVPLQHIALKGSVLSLAADITATLKYRNTGSSPMEAVFSFRQDKSAVYGAVVVKPDGTRVRMEAKETEDALDQYDDGISSGGADGPSSLKLSIGNLAAGDELTVEIQYIQEIGFDSEGFVELVLPLASCVPKDGLTVDLLVENTLAVECTSEHKVDIAKESETSTRVRLESHGKMQREISLRIELADKEPAALIENGEEYSAFSCCFVPDIQLTDAEDVKCELVFVCDRSGSMAGSRMKQTVNALNIFLGSLPEGCTFNIVSFGDRMEKMFAGSQPVSRRSFEIARAGINAFQANLGGTNVLQPLEEVLSAPLTLPRQVILLTDGDIDNVDEVLALVRRHRQAGVRLFSLGIGRDAGRALVYGVAREGGGSAEFCASGQRIETYCERQLTRALAPIIVNVSVESDIPMRVITPSKFLAFNKQPVVVYGILEEKRQQLASEKLRMKLQLSNGGIRIFDVPFRQLQGAGQRFQRLAVRSIAEEGHSVLQDALRLSVVCKGVFLVAVVQGSDRAAEGPMSAVNVNQKVTDSVVEVMKDNIASLLDRSDRLENLLSQSEDLRADSASFSASAARAEPSLAAKAGNFLSGLFKREEEKSYSSTSSTSASSGSSSSGAAPPRAPPPGRASAASRRSQSPLQQQQQSLIHFDEGAKNKKKKSEASRDNRKRSKEAASAPLYHERHCGVQGSLPRGVMLGKMPRSASREAPPPAAGPDSFASFSGYSYAAEAEPEQEEADDCDDEEITAPVVMKTSATRPVDVLVQLQVFDGSYSLSSQLHQVAGLDVTAAKPADLSAQIWATLFAVYLFQTRFSGQAKLVLKKARKFLLKHLSSDELDARIANIQK